MSTHGSVETPKKKLLVLDVNGLLVDRYFSYEKRSVKRDADVRLGKFYVYKRPLCDEFLNFCFEHFAIGIWSSARKHNVEKIVDFLIGEKKSQLLFLWDQLDCTDTGIRSPENVHKTIFLKELSKLWNKEKADLPWVKGEYSESNTLLIDDSPYKALRNPPHTGIFPSPYKASEEADIILGDLQSYLKGLLHAVDVQMYVRMNHFGQSTIDENSPHWNIFEAIIAETPINCEKLAKASKSSIPSEASESVLEQQYEIRLSEHMGQNAGANKRVPAETEYQKPLTSLKGKHIDQTSSNKPNISCSKAKKSEKHGKPVITTDVAFSSEVTGNSMHHPFHIISDNGQAPSQAIVISGALMDIDYNDQPPKLLDSCSYKRSYHFGEAPASDNGYYGVSSNATNIHSYEMNYNFGKAPVDGNSGYHGGSLDAASYSYKKKGHYGQLPSARSGGSYERSLNNACYDVWNAANAHSYENYHHFEHLPNDQNSGYYGHSFGQKYLPVNWNYKHHECFVNAGSAHFSNNNYYSGQLQAGGNNAFPGQPLNAANALTNEDAHVRQENYHSYERKQPNFMSFPQQARTLIQKYGREPYQQPVSSTILPNGIYDEGLFSAHNSHLHVKRRFFGPPPANNWFHHYNSPNAYNDAYYSRTPEGNYPHEYECVGHGQTVHQAWTGSNWHPNNNYFAESMDAYGLPSNGQGRQLPDFQYSQASERHEPFPVYYSDHF